MNKIKKYGWLPKPIQVLIKGFLAADPHDPEVYEATPDEISQLAEEEEIFVQLVFDRSYQKWFLVAVGDSERTIKSELIYHNPYRVKRSILAFCQVDEEFIKAKKHELERKRLLEQEYLEYDDALGGWSNV